MENSHAIWCCYTPAAAHAWLLAKEEDKSFGTDLAGKCCCRYF